MTKVSIEIEVHDDTSYEEIEKIVGNALNEHGIDCTYDTTAMPIFEKEENYDFYEEREHQKKVTPVADLPGWEWQEYDDGSGALVNTSTEKDYYSYDLNPYAVQHGIEYQKEEDDHHDIFWGSFQAFKAFAEKQIKENME